MTHEWRDFQDGFFAGIHGVDPRGCPYPKLTKEWRVWQKWHAWGLEIHNEIERIEMDGRERDYNDRPAPDAAEEKAAQEAAEAASIAERVEVLRQNLEKDAKE